jgi:hypothetical protein
MEKFCHYTLVKLTKGQVNTVVVTLFEKTTIDPANYLFAVKAKDTKSFTYFLSGADTSTALGRYNRFDIEEKASPDLSNGEVELSEGEYTYYVYQLTDAQVTAIDFNSVDLSIYGDPVEGPKILRVYDNTNNLNTEYNTSATNTVYE